MRGTIISFVAIAFLWAFTDALGIAQPAPNVTQWDRIEETAAELVQQGYTIAHINTFTSGSDVLTDFYLIKGADTIRCSEGYRPATQRSWVINCMRLVKPRTAK